MRIIEKIEIENFRSFLGTTKDDRAEILEISDLNIFSGANDSGKSNILRALNLFFNDEINRNEKFFFKKDLNINKQESGKRVVKIQIFFDISWDNNRDKFLPSKFSISKFYNIDGFRNYIYEFSLNNIDKPIKIDSRAENNEDVYKLFLPKNFKTLDEIKKDEEIKKARGREWNYRVKFSGFLNKSISFQYVSAIKDESFFSYLYGKTISKILENERDKIKKLEIEKKSIENWQKTMKNKTTKSSLMLSLGDENWRLKRIKEIGKEIIEVSRVEPSIKEFEKKINELSNSLFSSAKFLDSEFQIGNNLSEFFEGFNIGTGSNKGISLKLRGDGLQAKFIPEIFNFLDDIQNDKKYFIWGFEEPENSSEYKNQQELAVKLKGEFLNDRQIFITTHSEEFLSIYDDSTIEKTKRKANLYHVRKISNNHYKDFSVIKPFSVENNTFDFGSEKSLLEEDLGSSFLRAKYSKESKEKDDLLVPDGSKNYAL